MTAYIDPQSPRQFRDLARYTLADGCPAITVAIIFAGNYAAAERPYLRANNDDPPTAKPFNDNIQQVLDDGSVQYLQARGVKVLLSITNGHHPVGWSQFTSRHDARAFARYLNKEVVGRYGLDGIDIDDEYSSGVPNGTSLIMVTTLMRRIMPDKIISKALWSDHRYFRSTWKGHTLAANLDYGWEMSYGDPPQTRLGPYTRWLNKDQLSLGFWSGAPSPTPAEDVQWVRDHGYAGVMVYGFEDQTNVSLMGDLVNAWYGPGNWNEDGAGAPHCSPRIRSPGPPRHED
jgi:Glycosyl hydrolases family 18